MKNEYIADGYVRVSREDGDKPESDSISNQKKLIEDYLKTHPEIRLNCIKVDDGYSGVNFERPSFIEMTEDIKSGRINCVIVKDLSRFGRNWLETGQYLQRIFPALGVRFIAINDNYDSLYSDLDTNQLILPIRNIINDSYAGDISKKTRSAFDVKRKCGEFIGAFAIYGYQKDPNDKHKLIVDERTADVVKDIFRWKIQGMTLSGIAQKLNEYGVLSPMEYKKQSGINYSTSFKGNIRPLWSAVTVKRILTNEIYLGHLVQGKRSSKNYKIKDVDYKPETEWIRVENTHEPIIAREDFDAVNRLMNIDTRISPNSDRLCLFSGVLFCGDCRQNMIRKCNVSNGKKYYYYVCSTHKNDKEHCSTHNFSEEKLNDIVLTALKLHINNVAEIERALKNADKTPDNSIIKKRLQNEINEKMLLIGDKENKKKSLYEDLSDGFISREDYLIINQKYSEEIACLKEAAEKLRNDIADIEKPLDYSWLDYFKRYRNIQKLDREMIVYLINSIFIYEDKRIEIIYNYSDEYAAAVRYINADPVERAVI